MKIIELAHSAVNTVKGWADAKVATVTALATAGATAAHAEVPTEVVTALTEMKADALVVAGLVLVAIIAVAAFKFMRKGF